VADPLTPAVHRHAHQQFDLRHLERRGVGVPQQVTDELPVVAHPSGALAVADARGLHHGGVVPHAVDEGHEAVIEDGELPPPEAFEAGGAVTGRGLGFVHGRS
jgi:hypothetical protein